MADHAVGEQADRQDVVEMRVAEQDVLDAASSSSGRSPTPVPASMSTSSSSRKAVVLQPAAMEPEQPRTLDFM